MKVLVFIRDNWSCAYEEHVYGESLEEVGEYIMRHGFTTSDDKFGAMWFPAHMVQQVRIAE